MKITTTKLRQIIKEELRLVLEQTPRTPAKSKGPRAPKGINMSREDWMKLPAAEQMKLVKQVEAGEDFATPSPAAPPPTGKSPYSLGVDTDFGVEMPPESLKYVVEPSPTTKKPPKAKRRGWKRAGSVEEAAQDSSNKTHVRRGMRGGAVKQVQDILCEKGYDDMCQVVESGRGYGRFGPRTQSAVQSFQRDFGAKLGTRGIVGHETGTCLLDPNCPEHMGPPAPEEPTKPAAPEVDLVEAERLADIMQDGMSWWGTDLDDIWNGINVAKENPGMTAAMVKIFNKKHGRDWDGGNLYGAFKEEVTDDERLKFIQSIEDTIEADKAKYGEPEAEAEAPKARPLPKKRGTSTAANPLKTFDKPGRKL